MTIPHDDYRPRLDRILDTNGDGTGTKNANVDGSSTAVMFKLNPPSSGWHIVQRMIVMVGDTGVFSAEKYGVLTALTNGIQVGMWNSSDDSIAIDFMDGVNVKNNAAWGRLCYDVDLKSWGAGDSFLLARWTFSKAGTQLFMNYNDSTYFGVKVQDALTGLTDHYFTVQGFSKP